MSKTKPTQPPTPPAETDLPEGWAFARLPDVAEIIMGQSPPGSTYNEDGDGLPFFQGKAEFGERHPTIRKWCSAPNKIAEAGDILISIRAPVGPTNVADRTCAIGRGLAAIRPLGGIPTDLLLHALRLQEDELASQGTGSTFTAINRDNLDAVELSVPPLPEQKRIVAKVEALLERVNAARARLARLPAILKRFRQSVLAAACSGQLTAEWREDTMLPATGAELLQHIAQERQAAQANKHRSRRRDSDDEDSSGAAPVTWEVPDTWEWAAISDLLHYERSAAYGVLQPGSDLPSGVPFVRVCDLANGTVDTSQIKRIAPEIDKQYPRTRLQGDEVLVSLVGTIGRIAVAPKAIAGANVARAIGMLPLCPHVLPQYLRFVLENPAKNTELVDLAREVARKTLNLGLLKAVTVPLPPEPEQREIVRRVEALFALADGIAAHVRAATVRTERMPQAILARAFRGELVPTEAELATQAGQPYESATELLARVRAERDAIQPAARKRGKAEEPDVTPTTKKPRRGERRGVEGIRRRPPVPRGC